MRSLAELEMGSSLKKREEEEERFDSGKWSCPAMIWEYMVLRLVE